MQRVIVLLGAAMMFLAASAWALSPEEVIKLKNAGVSDATIQKMLELERARGKGPVSQQGNEIVYSAGEGAAEAVGANRRREREKERQAMEVLQGTVIDMRNPPATGAGQQSQ